MSFRAFLVTRRTTLRLTRDLRSCLQGNLPDEHSFSAYFAQRGRERPSEKEIKETETQSEGMGEGRERGKEIEKKSGSDDFQMGQKTQTHTHTGGWLLQCSYTPPPSAVTFSVSCPWNSWYSLTSLKPGLSQTSIH